MYIPFICVLTFLSHHVFPCSLSLGFFPVALYFEALGAERGVCLLYSALQYSSLDGSIFVLCLGQCVYRQNLAVFKMIVIYSEKRRLEHTVFKPLSFEPELKQSLLIMWPFSTSLYIICVPVIPSLLLYMLCFFDIIGLCSCFCG